jgi:KipI family sensor histidine kinase inhibitor
VIRPFGEASLLVELESAASAQALAESLRASPIEGIVGAVPGLRSLLVDLDPLVEATERATTELRVRLDSAAAAPPAGRLRRIPVAYGGNDGPDLAEVATLAGLSEAEVVALHAATELRVLFLGFAPGFAYLGDLPDALRVPRLETPRTRTPAGSVAIAGPMSGIYPADLPGGWRVIGRTSIALFDPHGDPPAFLAPGDVVRFERA